MAGAINDLRVPPVKKECAGWETATSLRLAIAPAAERAGGIGEEEPAWNHRSCILGQAGPGQRLASGAGKGIPAFVVRFTGGIHRDPRRQSVSAVRSGGNLSRSVCVQQLTLE